MRVLRERLLRKRLLREKIIETIETDGKVLDHKMNENNEFESDSTT